MNEGILKMLETYGPLEGFPYDFKTSDIKDYSNRIIPHLPLPENEAEKVALEVNKLSNSLQSVKGAMQEAGEKFPERKIAEIISERQKFMGQGAMTSKLNQEQLFNDQQEPQGGNLNRKTS
jgi:hypothetical protein